jgi:predicted dehydrogenase
MNGPVNVALYGANGHQIHDELMQLPRARLVAAAQFPKDKLPPGVRCYDKLDDLLRDPEIHLISLCSPRRIDQARDAVKSLLAGKHVYAEKPCALTETELDAILDAAKRSGRQFREMAGTAFCQPYYAMREIVLSGRLGKIIQVIAEKSYPYQTWRPQDENMDGGLICQCAIHAMRFVEHVACQRVDSVHALETTAGNPVANGGLRMAAGMLSGLEQGGIAVISANYLNQRGTGIWGYESLRIIGSDGFVESHCGGEQTRLVIGGIDHGPLDISAAGINYLGAFIDTILGLGVMPLTTEEELSPTRWVLRAKRAVHF